MGFGSGANNPTTILSKQLQRILDTSCIQCYDTFDNGARKPYIVGPCQYTLCERCINDKLFSQQNESICPDCSIPIYKSNIMPNRLIMTIMKLKEDINVYFSYKTEPTAEQISAIQREMANKFMQNFNTTCHSCYNMFNSDDRQPIVICPMQHFMCSECLITKQKSLTKCGGCQKPVYPFNQKHKSKILKEIVQFVSNTCFNKKLHLVVQDKVYKMIIYETVTIKDAFHTLQDAHLISQQLEITQCKFYVEDFQQYSFVEKQVKFNSPIQQIMKKESEQVRVIMKYSNQALKKGQKVTMASKIIRQLPIKIINFKQHSKFGSQQHVNLYPIIEQENLNRPLFKQRKQNPYLPTSSINNSKRFRLQEQELPQQKRNLIKYNIQKSSLRQIQRQRVMQKKKSNIQRKKQMPIGTQIDQKLLQNYSIKINNNKNFQRQKVFQLFLKNHQINFQTQQFICFRTQKIINKPFTQQQLNQHYLLQKEIEGKAKNNDILSQLLMILGQELHDGKIEVLFTAKSNVRSQMSLKIITSHFISDRLIIKQKILEDKTWFFEKIYESPEELYKFLDFQKKRIHQKFGIAQQNLVFHKLSKGPSLVLQMSTNQGASIANNIKNNLNIDIQLQPFFKQLQLSPEDFDKKGYISFPKQKKKVQFRGNWPYYQPINCCRYGIKVNNLFDNGNNDWLKMSNLPGEWAVGFHGVRNPNHNYKQYKNLIQNIIHSSINKKFHSIIIEQQNLSYQFEKCANKPNETIGKGIKLTPSFESALSQTQEIEIDKKKYHLVFQCRLDPKKIKIRSKDNNQWIINQSAAIRPYGIVIIENSIRMNYPTIEQQFGKKFIYQQFKEKIQKN